MMEMDGQQAFLAEKTMNGIIISYVTEECKASTRQTDGQKGCVARTKEQREELETDESQAWMTSIVRPPHRV